MESGAFFDVNNSISSEDEKSAEHTISDVAGVGNDGNIDEDVTSQPVVPFVGMTFEDPEEAHKLYNDYAYKMGFGTRIASSKNSRKKGQEKVVINKTFECVHAGKTIDTSATAKTKPGSGPTVQSSATDMSTESKDNKKQAGSAMRTSDTRKRNRMLRHNCKARMIVSLQQGRYTITTFNDEHTHPMVKQLGRRRYYRSHRKIPEEDREFLELMHNRNLRTSDIMGLLGDAHGGDPRNLGYVKRDVTNERSKMRAKLLLRDLDLTVEYFEKRRAENPNFYYATQVDGANSVLSLFWVDGRTKLLYPKWRDCVFFDTTFCTNRYNMPFAPIVGINNHLQTIVLGCALLADETIEGFKWVFQKWLEAMDGVQPAHIMTDQDQAMATAIGMVFPDAIHRCCFWHVCRIAKTKIGKPLRDGEPFATAFWACIFGTDTVDQFENSWTHMLQCFQMTEHKHLANMWKTRKTWAPVYFRHNFFPFTSTTGRSEGLNSYFKTLVHPSDSVWTFVRQFELCQDMMLDREDNAGFIVETTFPPLWGRLVATTTKSAFEKS